MLDIFKYPELGFFALDFPVIGFSSYWIFQLLDSPVIGFSSHWSFQLLDFPDIGFSSDWIYQLLDFPGIGFSSHWIFQLLNFPVIGFSTYWIFQSRNSAPGWFIFWNLQSISVNCKNPKLAVDSIQNVPVPRSELMNIFNLSFLLL